MKKFKRSFQNIITLENLLRAWKGFLRDKKERKDVIFFQMKLMDNIILLLTEITEKRYIHGEYHSFNISDPKPRNIHKATVRDRLLFYIT